MVAPAKLRTEGLDHVAIDRSDHDISHSVYFDDPDGHQIELTTHEV